MQPLSNTVSIIQAIFALITAITMFNSLPYQFSFWRGFFDVGECSKQDSLRNTVRFHQHIADIFFFSTSYKMYPFVIFICNKVIIIIIEIHFSDSMFTYYWYIYQNFRWDNSVFLKFFFVVADFWYKKKKIPGLHNQK